MSAFRFKDKFKANLSSKYSQEYKRNEYLRRQKERRRDLSMQLRVLSHDILPSESNSKRHKKNLRKVARPHMVSNQLCEPEWMTEVPYGMVVESDDGRIQCEWIVLARPEGRRCVVISSKGCTVSYLENGRVLHQFKSFLPGGGLSAQGGSSAILDCIYYEPSNIYYILDIMSWNDMHCYECTAEFRFYWLRAKLDETPFIAPPPPSHAQQQQHFFVAAPCWECSMEGLREAYLGHTPFTKNGLLFYHREGHYEVGLTPLVLLWKDVSVTSYLDDAGDETIALRVVDDVCPADEGMSVEQFSERPVGEHASRAVSETVGEGGSAGLSAGAMLCTLEGVSLVAWADVLQGLLGGQRQGLEGAAPDVSGVRGGTVVRGSIQEAGYDQFSGAPYVRGFILHKVTDGHTERGGMN